MKYLFLVLLYILFGCSSEKITENQIYKIGTKSFQWTDVERVDDYYGGQRIINVQIWYPLDTNESTSTFSPSQYYYEIDRVYKNLNNWSEADYKVVSKIPVNSLVNGSISKAPSKFPVLLLSPSLGGNISQYTYYAEQLVKAGFVVVGINHLYESEYVIDEEMNIFPTNVAFHDSLKTLDIPKQITAERYRAVKGERQKVLGEDLVFCINKLEQLNQSEFSGQLDLQNIGAFGHSIGGAAAVYAAILDNRILAVLNIDGTPPSVALKNGIKVPFMFIEDLTDYKNHVGYKKMHQRRSSFCEINSADSYRVLLGGTNHNSFLDINYHLAENKAEQELALAILQKTTFYLNEFFGHYLLGTELGLKEVEAEALEIIKFAKK